MKTSFLPEGFRLRRNWLGQAVLQIKKQAVSLRGHGPDATYPIWVDAKFDDLFAYFLNANNSDSTD